MDNELGLMTGIDLLIDQLQIIIHQPTILEISMMGEKEFFSAIQFICIDKAKYQDEKDKVLLENINNFQLFMNIITDERMAKQKKNVLLCFDLLFPKYKITIIPKRSLLFNSDDENVIIDEQNFEILQKIIKKMFKIEQSQEEAFNPVDDKAAEIAKKLQRGRDRVAREKAAKGEGINSIKQYLSIIPFACPSMSLTDANNLTIYQLYTLIERYRLFISWDLDIRTRLAGGSPDSQPENWMKNI